VGEKGFSSYRSDIFYLIMVYGHAFALGESDGNRLSDLILGISNRGLIINSVGTDRILDLG